MSYDLLLTWISERGAGSWQSFVNTHSWLFAGDEGDEAGDPPYFTALKLAMLGHLEFNLEAGQWSAAPPVLTLLPSAGGYALLTGSRTRHLLKRLGVETSEEVTLGLLPERHRQEGGPEAIFIASQSERELEALAARLGIAYEFSVADRLSRLLPDLDSVLGLRPSTPPAYGFELARFVPGQLRWEEVGSESGVGLYRSRAYGKNEYRLVDQRGHYYSVDYATGVYAELARVGLQVLEYEAEELNGTLFAPVRARLPVLCARTAVMCSGLLPVREGDMRSFANVPVAVAERIAHSLGQAALRGRQPS